jgi:hypothetical protein
MTDTPETGDQGHTVRPFAAFFRELRSGAAHTEASRHVQDLVAAVKATGKAGDVIIKIHVAPSKAHNMVEITDTVTPKIPAPRPASMFWVDDDGNPVRTDPNQETLPLMEVVPEPAKPIREVQ